MFRVLYFNAFSARCGPECTDLNYDEVDKVPHAFVLWIRTIVRCVCTVQIRPDQTIKDSNFFTCSVSVGRTKNY